MEPRLTEEVLHLLNYSQSGQVVIERGISLDSFLSSMTFSIIFCMIQMVLFVHLRRRHKGFYYYNDNHGWETHKLLSWQLFNPFNYLNISGYKSKVGMDAFLLLRFLYMSLYMFMGISIVSVTVLLPVNYCYGIHNDHPLQGGTVRSVMGDTTTWGLDLISTSSISVKHTDKCIYHFAVCVVIIVWFHHVLIQELNYTIKMKQQRVICKAKDSTACQMLRTLYVGNIDLRIYRTTVDVERLFNSFIPGCVQGVYPIRDHCPLAKEVEMFEHYRNLLEEHICHTVNHPGKVAATMRLPVQVGYLKIWLPGLSAEVPTYPYLFQQMHNHAAAIKKIRDQLVDDPTNLTLDKAFVKFHRVSDAYTVRQMLISSNPRHMSVALGEVDLRSINWNSVVNSKASLYHWIRKVFLFAISTIVIMCWVVPVAFVGSISQLPYLTSLIPTISWINGLPHVVTAFIASILPTVVLTFLTSVALQIFSALADRKRKLTGSAREVSIQKWLFVFLFFQLFIVISISSGFVAVIQQLLYNPISVPHTVASDLPKAATFFFSFFLLRGLNLFSSCLLQFYAFVRDVVVYPHIIAKTPRQRYLHEQHRHTAHHKFGQIYPTFSVYGSIGIVYSVISPLITIFCCLNLVIDLVAYKYTLKYTMNKDNANETHGTLYSLALRQMYAGVYSLEVYMMGLLFTVRNEHGQRVCTNYGFCMLLITMATIYAHILINRCFDSRMAIMPLELFSHMEHNREGNNRTDEQYIAQQVQHAEYDYHNAAPLSYNHPTFDFTPALEGVWLPSNLSRTTHVMWAQFLANNGLALAKPPKEAC